MASPSMTSHLAEGASCERNVAILTPNHGLIRVLMPVPLLCKVEEDRRGEANWGWNGQNRRESGSFIRRDWVGIYACLAHEST